MTTRGLSTEVLVVGAGPVGLLLAGELRLGGVAVVVVERLAAPTGESRASQLNARTMEIFDQRGLLERLGETQRQEVGHFGGLPLDVSEAPSAYPAHWKIPQFRTEEVLQAWATELGADIRRGHELRELAEAHDYVVAEVAGPDGPVRVRARYVVGCDGENSAVRRLTGFDFPGASATRDLLRTDVAGIDVPDRRFQRNEHGLAVAARRADGVTRVMVHEFARPSRHRGGAPRFAEVAEAWERTTGEDISGGTPIWVDAFDNASRLTTRYRRGRVLLAGDAAHRQMPIGGQALNLGLQDAMNLGWKLAAQVHGWAPADLLDSYHDERHPVGARVLTNVRAQELLLLGGGEVEPARAVFAELLDHREARAHLTGMVTGLDIRYDVGPGDHPLLGQRVPHCALRTEAGPTTTTASLRAARGVLFSLATEDIPQPTTSAAAWTGRVAVVAAHVENGTALAGATALLVRPDGHIVWVGTGGEGPRAALNRWFGKPAENRREVNETTPRRNEEDSD